MIHTSDLTEHVYLSANKLSLTLLDVPTLSDYTPSVIFNTAKQREVTIYGTAFFNSQHLLCYFSAEGASTKAIFVSKNQVICPLSMGKVNSQSEIEIYVSNDGLRSLSTGAAKVKILKKLPYLTGMN